MGPRWATIIARTRVALALAWAIATALGSVVLVVVLANPAACLHPSGDSIYGDTSLSVVPFGPRCIWTEAAHGVADTAGPHPLWTIYALAVIGGGAALWYWFGFLGTQDGKAADA